MVAYIISFLMTASLMSTSIALALAPQPPSNRKRHGERNVGSSSSPPTGAGTGSRDKDNNEGRSRYSNSRRDGRSQASGPKNSSNKNKNAPPRPMPGEKQELPPAPPLTEPNSHQPRPWYFTCRHTYEETLMEEIHRYDEIRQLSCSSPFPGIVRVEQKPAEDNNNNISLFSSNPPYDPVYALQSMPNAVIVSAESIKGLAREIYGALLPEEEDEPKDRSNEAETSTGAGAFSISNLREALRQAPRGSLALHALVPGMGKGQRDPVMLRRSTTTANTLADMLQKEFGAARKKAKVQNDHDSKNDTSNHDISKEQYLLQVLLLTPEVTAASLTQCHYRPFLGTWPNWQLPAGLADADVEGSDIPSSAYRKLLEALNCMSCHPTSTTTVVDLGASPGGWTAVLRRLGCRVIAVDRSELAPNLMKDKGVEFVKGDAFTFVPPPKKYVEQSRWMVSDIIAYPDRIQELLERWCGGHWASHLVVTVKFQGEMPAWSELDKCIQIAENHGYECRAKHFFNNKHEVTLMAVERSLVEDTSTSRSGRNESDILGKSIYPVTLPASQ
jgi:hypothetical protein